MRHAMRDPIEVRLTGAGGQGVISAGVILAEAGLRDGKNVVQTQTYGPEARLGASKAEVIFSSHPIAYPEVIVPDVLLCLSKDAARKYIANVRESTIVVLDSSADDVEQRATAYRFPLAQTAVEAGSKAATNVVALWVLNSITGLVSPESLRGAILERLPARFRAGNERALEAAQELVAHLTAPAEGRPDHPHKQPPTLTPHQGCRDSVGGVPCASPPGTECRSTPAPPSPTPPGPPASPRAAADLIGIGHTEGNPKHDQ